METLRDIWVELGARVRRFVGRRVNDQHAADDITQDVLLKVRTRMDGLAAEEKLPAWVFAVARNAVTDYYRARAVRDHADVADVDVMAGVSDPEADEAVRALSACLGRMVEQLPEPYRQALRLVDVEGLSQNELAGRVGVSLSGAKSRVQRARGLLREMLQDCCDVERDGRGNVLDFERTRRSGRYCGDEDGKPRCGT